MILYVMGVSGSGKTTIGLLLAMRLRFSFYDGDDYHSPANKAKMAAGHPLDDADREPWLKALNELAKSIEDVHESGVIVCSALKQQYRDELTQGIAREQVHFILLEGSRELIAGRLALRKHEYMNPKLLDSQLDTLETPEEAIRIVNNRTPEEAVVNIAAQLRNLGAIPQGANDAIQTL